MAADTVAALTPERMKRLRRLALELAGIGLLERHGEIIAKRCARLGILEDAGLDALLDAAERGDADARQRLIGLLTTNVSGFFRNPRHFDLAAEHALWAAHRRGSARVWSAAASTGEEPYSLAMALIDLFQRDDPPVTILATDIDELALAKARDACFDATTLGTLPPGFRERFFEPAGGEGRERVAEAVRALVRIEPLNLTSAEWPIEGPFDVVFCRNVLMYLEDGHRYSVLERMTSVLAPDGILILDPAEHLGRAGHLFDQGTNGIHAAHGLSPDARRGTR